MCHKIYKGINMKFNNDINDEKVKKKINMRKKENINISKEEIRNKYSVDHCFKSEEFKSKLRKKHLNVYS